MRAQHTPHHLPSFPVYSSAFLSPNELVLGGGGGASRSGIKNKLRLYRVSDDRALHLINELELEQGEDAPMSMDAHLETRHFICGINSSTEKIKEGKNENCRVYGVQNDKLSLTASQGTLTSGDVEAYQKVTRISPDGLFLVAAGAHDLSLLRYPSLTSETTAIKIEKGEIYDLTFSPSVLVVATANSLLVYALPTPRRTSPGKRKKKPKPTVLSTLQLSSSVDLPTLPGGVTSGTFRAARFHPQDARILYTVINATPPRDRATRNAPRPSFICKWDTEKWQVTGLRKVGERGVTCFDVSPNGRFLAYGSSDYTIGLADAETLGPLLTILKAHEFPSTTLRFNPTSSLLVSGSADNSVRVVSVPSDLRAASSWTVMMVIIAMLVIMLALLAQAMR